MSIRLIEKMSNDFGKVSIIVPVFNVEIYIDECINSILHQTYQNLEILIIDDGSEDNCGNIVDEYAKTDGRVKVFHKENGGISSARNLALKHATGEYYCFIDSDDFYELDFVEKMISALVNSKADMVFCNYYSCYVDRNTPGRKYLEVEDGRVFSSEEYLRWFYGYSGACAFMWNKMFKKEIFRNLEFKNMLCEDAQIMLYIIDRCQKIIFISNVLYHYRRRKSSVANSKKEAMLLDKICYLKEHMDRLKETQRPSLFNLAQKQYIRKMIEEYYFCSKKTRREIIRPLLKKEMKEFMRNPDFDRNLRIKYWVASLIPFIYRTVAPNQISYDSFWN